MNFVTDPSKRAEFVKAVLRQKFVILGTVGLFAFASMAGFKYITKKFKVQATIGIQTQYFQIPLVRDFMPETFDGQEIRAQRESLIHKALNQDYAIDLGKRFGLFHLKKGEEPTTGDAADVISRFEVFPASASTYIVGFFSSDPYAGYKIMKDFLNRVKTTLAEERRAKLVRLHDAIEDRIEVLSYGKGGGSSPMLARRPDLLQKEIEHIQEELKVLKSTYSDKHPKVTALTRRLQEITKMLAPVDDSNMRRHNPGIFSGSKVDEASRELFQDLVKKYHYLEVVMYLDEQNTDTYLSMIQEPYVPTAPMWPKRSIILIWSVVTGFLVGSMLALVLEVYARRKTVFRRALDVLRSESARVG